MCIKMVQIPKQSCEDAWNLQKMSQSLIQTVFTALEQNNFHLDWFKVGSWEFSFHVILEVVAAHQNVHILEYGWRW